MEIARTHFGPVTKPEVPAGPQQPEVQWTSCEMMSYPERQLIMTRDASLVDCLSCEEKIKAAEESTKIAQLLTTVTQYLQNDN